MRKITPFLLFLQSIFGAAQSQPEKPNHFAYAPFMQPVFDNPEDSAKSEQLRQWMTMSNPPISRDSVWSIYLKLNARVVGHTPVYRSDPTFKTLDQVLESDLSSLKKISIQNTSKIDNRILRCKEITTIEFVNTSLKRIPARLRKLDSLKKIYVINNRSERPLRLGKNRHIQELIVRGSQPSILPRRYTAFKKLKTLDLSGTALTEIPEQVFSSKNLKNLLLKGNRITLTNYTFPYNLSLERLDLSSNYIHEVPSSIGNLSGLTKLSLSYNDIEVIQSGFSKLKQLASLALYSNKLRAFPEALYELKNLHDLDVYFNEIERLDNRIMNWQNLEILYLANNKLLSLPNGISQLKNLRALYLHNNRLSSLPEGITALTDLKVLRVNKNNLLALPETMSNLKSLENFDVSQNKLTSLPNDFWRYPNIKILSLAANLWDENELVLIKEKASELRKNNVIVNLSDEAQENEENP